MGQELGCSVAGYFWPRVCFMRLQSSQGWSGVDGSASKMVYSHGTSCWQEASIPHHVDLCMNFLSDLMIWQLASLTLSDPGDQSGSQSFSSLPWKPHSLILQILLTTQASPIDCRRLVHKSINTRRKRSLGNQLPHSVYLLFLWSHTCSRAPGILPS